MKNGVIKTVLAGFLVLASLKGWAQDVSVRFLYDECGNRISRSIQLYKTEENGKNVEEENGILSEANDCIGDAKISIFPNPSKGMVIVEAFGNEQKDIKATLTTLTGSLIEEKNLFGSRQEFDLSGKPSGVYLLKLLYGEETRTWKIIKN